MIGILHGICIGDYVVLFAKAYICNNVPLFCGIVSQYKFIEDDLVCYKVLFYYYRANW